MITDHLGLVKSIAKGYAGMGTDYDDLVQEGTIGLMIAEKRFDPEKGFTFSTYATNWIRQAIRRYIKMNRSVRVPENIIAVGTRIKSFQEKFYKKTGKEPSVKEIADTLHLKETTVDRVLIAIKQSVSIETSTNDDDDNCTLKDMIEDRSVDIDRELNKNLLEIEVQKALERFPMTEKAVVIFHYGLDKRKPFTYREIGNVCGFSYEWARKLENRALEKLKNNKTLESYYKEVLN